MPDNRQKKSILLVEDNQEVIDSLLWLLNDHSVVIAKNGQQALAALEQDPLPGVILLDLMMPVVDGMAFRKIKQETPRIASIPTIIMSARNKVEMELSLLSHEIFLPKPLDIKKLFAHIQHLLI